MLFRNFISLNLLNFFNYAAPLLTVPYLTRVLGVENFGLFNLALAFASYFMVATDYGFNITATKEIAERRNDPGAAAAVFGEVMGAKLLLASFAFPVFVLIVYAHPPFRAEALLYLLSFSVVLNNVLFPLWLFQGVQRMEYITLINAAIRALYVALVFLLVRTPGDYLMLAGINLANALAAGAAGWYAARRLMSAPRWPGWAGIRRRLASGFFAFPPSVALGAYSYSVLFIIGVFCGNAAAGHYAGAYKIVSVVMSVSGVLAAVVFPHVNSLAALSRRDSLRFVRKVALAAAFFFLPVCGFMSWYSGEITIFLLGAEFSAASGLLAVLSFLPLVGILNNLISTQAVMALGLKSYFSKIYTIVPCAGLLALLVLVPAYGPGGGAWAALLTEAVTLSVSLVYLKRRGVRIVS